MIKSDIVATLSLKFPRYSTVAVNKAVTDIVDNLTQALLDLRRIEVRGFGSFTVRYHESVPSHDPRTGAKIMASAKYKPHFKLGKVVYQRMNE